MCLPHGVRTTRAGCRAVPRLTGKWPCEPPAQTAGDDRPLASVLPARPLSAWSRGICVGCGPSRRRGRRGHQRPGTVITGCPPAAPFAGADALSSALPAGGVLVHAGLMSARICERCQAAVIPGVPDQLHRTHFKAQSACRTGPRCPRPSCSPVSCCSPVISCSLSAVTQARVFSRLREHTASAPKRETQ